MANLLRTEWYKLWHSWYFWGIGIFTFLLSSILLLDSKGKTSNLVMASLYNTPLLYFLIIVFIALFIGNDFRAGLGVVPILLFANMFFCFFTIIELVFFIIIYNNFKKKKE